MAWPIIAAFVFLVLGLLIFLFKKKNIKDDKPNYKILFIVGITWIPLGITTKNPGFLVGGLVMMVAGLLKKDQWRNEKKWSELSPAEKKVKLAIIALLTLMLVTGVVTFFMYNN
ncbi:hypothetical protein HN388_06245 [bacterium]|jgi:tryptophan-rich sensory protein|nr:hypothetical protein [bacterium]MBT4291270.1 hypothetical protein [bacterium]MBT7311291.1 hypothetical protein [bacterium]